MFGPHTPSRHVGDVCIVYSSTLKRACGWNDPVAMPEHITPATTIPLRRLTLFRRQLCPAFVRPVPASQRAVLVKKYLGARASRFVLCDSCARNLSADDLAVAPTLPAQIRRPALLSGPCPLPSYAAQKPKGPVQAYWRSLKRHHLPPAFGLLVLNVSPVLLCRAVARLVCARRRTRAPYSVSHSLQLLSPWFVGAARILFAPLA